MNVPFVDLQTQYRELEPDILDGLKACMGSTGFILGPAVQQFEKEFAEFCGVDHVVGLASGCDALLWALKAHGIGPGDEVITAANTFIATVLAITASGAQPVLVDCMEKYHTLDPVGVEAAITRRTRALMPVHLYGQAADMDAVNAIARKHGLIVIEDAAQAHGAIYKNRKCGTLGDIGCFSFYPGKNLGAYGDGGAVTTSNPDIAEWLKTARNYGQKEKNRHDIQGWNSRLDSLQAVILSIKLNYLDRWNALRREHAAYYTEHLKHLPLVLPETMPHNVHVFHLFVVRCEKRDALIEHLKQQGVSCGIHYPCPVHLQPCYGDLGYVAGQFPAAERISNELISLPMYPELTPTAQDYVCEQIASFYS